MTSRVQNTAKGVRADHPPWSTIVETGMLGPLSQRLNENLGNMAYTE